MHTCLFDIDGTLISTGGAGKQAMETALASAFGITQLTDAISFAGRTDRAITRDIFLHFGIEDSQQNWERFRSAYLEHLPIVLRERQGCVLPGIATLLAELSERKDMTLALLTGNTQAGARHKLARYELDHYFEFGGFGDVHVDRCDVARDALREVQQRARGDVDLDRVWVIGDTIFDIQCGRSIGARVIAVATGAHTADQLAAANPDCLITDCSDLPRLRALWS